MIQASSNGRPDTPKSIKIHNPSEDVKSRTRRFWTVMLLRCRLRNPEVDLLFVGSSQGSAERLYIKKSACHFSCYKGASKSAQVLLNDIEAVMVFTLIFLN